MKSLIIAGLAVVVFASTVNSATVPATLFPFETTFNEDEVTAWATMEDEMTTEHTTSDNGPTGWPTLEVKTPPVPFTDNGPTVWQTSGHQTPPVPFTDNGPTIWLTSGPPTPPVHFTDNGPTRWPTTTMSDESTHEPPTFKIDETTNEPTIEDESTIEKIVDLTTIEPFTENVVTHEPITEDITTNEPTTDDVTTNEPITEDVTTIELTTDDVTTNEPTTDDATTNEPTTGDVTTNEPTTDDVTTNEPITEGVTTIELTTFSEDDATTGPDGLTEEDLTTSPGKTWNTNVTTQIKLSNDTHTTQGTYGCVTKATTRNDEENKDSLTTQDFARDDSTTLSSSANLDLNNSAVTFQDRPGRLETPGLDFRTTTSATRPETDNTSIIMSGGQTPSPTTIAGTDEECLDEDRDLNGTTTYAIKCVNVRENARTATLVVTRSQDNGVARLRYKIRTIKKGTKAAVVPVEGNVFFAPGSLTATITVPLVDDGQKEDDERHLVTISQPKPSGIIKKGTANLVVLDDD